MLTIEEYLERAKYIGRIQGMAETIEDEATRDGLYGDAEYLFGYLVEDATGDDNERNNALRRLQQDVVEYAMVKPEPKHENTNLEWLYSHPEELAALIYCPMPSPTCPHEEEVESTDDDDVCHRCLLDWLKKEHTDD